MRPPTEAALLFRGQFTRSPMSVKFPLQNIINLEFGDVAKSHQHRKDFKRQFALAGNTLLPSRLVRFGSCGHRQRFTRFAKCPAPRLELRRPEYRSRGGAPSGWS